uniref:Endo/exonuclease/phosphatase domain-containing protein n=1 Tax=Macrostomum lignano TaxID=282301 RepID=A0A1I8IR39_9PLAT
AGRWRINGPPKLALQDEQQDTTTPRYTLAPSDKIQKHEPIVGHGNHGSNNSRLGMETQLLRAGVQLSSSGTVGIRSGIEYLRFPGFIALLGVNLHFLATRGLVLPGPDNNQTSTTESVTVEDKVVIEDDKDAVCRNLDQHEFFVETVFPMLDLTLTAFVPFLVIATCNIKIVCKLRDVRKNSGLSASQSAFGGYRTTVMLLLTTFVFIALTAPVKIYLTVIGGSQPSGLDAKSDPNRFYSHRVVWSIMIALQFANHCCNFLLYCASNPKFRSEAVGLFSTCCFCCSGRRCSCCFCRLNDGSNYRNQRALSYLSPDGSADEQLEEQRQRRRQDSLQFHGQELSATYSGPACTNDNDMPMRSRAPTVHQQRQGQDPRGQRSAARRTQRRRERNRRSRAHGAAKRAGRREAEALDPPGGAGDHEAQQHRAPAVPEHPLRLATWNCRTLKENWRQGLLAKLAQETKMDLVALQEVSIVAGPGLQREELGAGWSLLYTSADERGHGGVGVLVGPKLQQSVCCQSLSPRLLRIDLRLRSRSAHIFCAYAPTAAHPDEARVFFEFLSGQVEAVAQRDTVIVLGDLNAVMRRSDRAPFVTPRENANTEALTDFVARHDMVSMNTWFRKPEQRLATFAGCKRPRRNNNRRRNATTRLAQLDHVLLHFRERGRVTNCDTIMPLAPKSDHKLLFCDIKLKDPLYRPPKRKPKHFFRALRDDATQVRFARAFVDALDGKKEADYPEICTAVQSAAEWTLPLVKPLQKGRPVWEVDPEVQSARLRLEQLRRAGRTAEVDEAEAALAAAYEQGQQAAVEETIRTVTTAGHDGKRRAVWSAVNALTGRKSRTSLNLPGDTAEARRNELRDFFGAIVNAPPPVLQAEMPLPPEVALPKEEDFDVSPITLDEVVLQAKKSPGGRAAGPDEIPVEALRVLPVARAVAGVMNRVLDGGAAPTEWTTAHMIPIPKKPGTTRKEEHRGISLMSCAAKLFNKILLTRLQPVLDPFLRHEQNGFRPHRGTATQILALRRTIEEARTRQATLICVFVDFRKAFDSVARGALVPVLRAYHVPQRLVSAVMALYQDTQAAVVTPDGLSDPFSTTSGVLQGDTLAPFLFVLVLDWVLRTALPSDADGFMLCRRTSSRHPEKRLSLLGYADDLALLASTADGAQRMLDSLVAIAATVGLVVNTDKTEVLTVPAELPANITCRGADGHAAPLPRCTRFTYLGGLVPSVQEDLARRRGLAWAAFRSVRVVLQSAALPDRLRSRLFQAVVETVLTYNAETWTLTETLEKRLDAAHSSLLRAAFGISYPEVVSNAALYRRAGLRPPSETIRRRRLQLAGHDVLLLTLRGPWRRGQARTRRYVDCLLADAGVIGQTNAAAAFREQARRRVL